MHGNTPSAKHSGQIARRNGRRFPAATFHAHRSAIEALLARDGQQVFHHDYGGLVLDLYDLTKPPQPPTQ